MKLEDRVQIKKEKFAQVKKCQVTKQYLIYYNQEDFCIMDFQIPCKYRYMKTTQTKRRTEYGCNNGGR